ncbi:hypothetical protein AK812_SmicGene24167 [Symbiodinium microadriaticum]|uniref:C3H1-type domain-containing protein n=1 Tax=Symbiodinium microadriaticum TaxID=2951 RepID=A0A1Q9DFA9_SYMMI|nr:hypothetical protein AK812_SmicGene24167 [Symbiodinium microadriaticum]
MEIDVHTVCFNFKKNGSCNRDNCPYAHINPATPAEGEDKPEAKAKGKPKTAAPAIRMCRAWNPLAPAVRKKAYAEEEEESECSSIDSDADSDCSTDDERDGATWSAKFNRRKSYKERGGEIVKVNAKKLVENENRANELGFAMHKARLKAQLMIDMVSDDRPGDRHMYVRVPGTDTVKEIVFFDGEDEIVEMHVDSQKSRGYGFVWQPGKDPFMLNPEGKRISLFVHGDIPYVRAGSQKAGPCDNEVAANIKAIFDDIGEDGSLSSAVADVATATATTGEDAEGPADDEVEGPPDDETSADETPDEEVPLAEAGRPPEPPDGGRENEAEDDREIEVEGEGAPTRKAKIGALKAEAKTLAHLCTHRYRNPYCEACIRAKMKHYRTERGGFKRELKSWGDLITFDFLDMRKAADMGMGNDDEDREILVVRDVATKVIAAIPTTNRYTEDVVDALRRLIGRRKVKLAYSDAAPEFDAAMAQLRIPVDHSLPGHPKNNSLAERTNQVVINTDVEGDGDSAWKRMTGEDFKGKAIPFGVKVFFKPTTTRKDMTYTGKFDPKGIPRIFAGYVITAGQQWSRKYRVWDMTEFANVNLSMNASVPRRLAQPFTTEVAVLPEKIEFPLKNEYERMNATLEGLKDNAELKGKEINDLDPGDHPPDGDHGDDDDDDDDDDQPPKLPPDPGEEDAGIGVGDVPIYDHEVLDAIGDKLLQEAAERGRLIPKGDEEDPGDILRRLKEAKLVGDDVEHWHTGGVAYKIGSDGRRIVPSRRPKHLYSPEEWDTLGAKARAKAYKKDKREKAKAAKKEKKRTAVGKKIVNNMLDKMIFPKVVQCNKIDLELGGSCTEGWEWAEEMVQQQVQDDYLRDVIPAVPACSVFNEDWIPAMPCTASLPQQQHRVKNPEQRSCFNAMVTRPVTRKEMISNPKAMEACMKEWKGLWDQEVFDYFSQTREYDDVIKEAKKKGEKVHMARVHGLIYEKNYQLKEDDPARKFKGRGVLLGDQVKDQNMEASLFQDLGNSPAAFDASRWADYYGCLPGTPCWVELPEEAWHPSANHRKFRRPVCRLVKALYGHPDAGTMWEQHCHTSVQKVGFKPLGDEWPSLYFHPEKKLLLVIYVDDLKMAGPKDQLPSGWAMLRKELRLEEETPLGLYLGCRISKGEATLHDKTRVQTVIYDMETYLDMTVKKYCDVTGYDPSKFKTVASPSPAEETKNHPARAPACSGKSQRCTWCGHTMPVDADGRLIPPPPVPKGPAEEEVTDENRGALAPQAASILMKLLYAARILRFDLLRSINNLARKITKWTKKEDVLLHHLMAYVHQSKHHMMIGWVGDSMETSSIGLFADADYAGCGESLKSTSGAHLHTQGPHTRFPLAGLSKRQGCLSHSTPEAEIVAAAFAMTRLGLPAITLWQQLGGKDPNFVFYDDNQTMIGVIRTGKNPTMRHLERTHGISIGWMHAIFQEGYVSLAYEVTAKMAADIHTKSFKDSVFWTHACQLINIFPPAMIGSQDIMDLMKPTHSQSTDEKGQQLYSFKSDVPCFPYTQTPILPQVLYRAGQPRKEGLQEHDSVDPILVVKFPLVLRDPPSALPPGRYLRSTWILREGVWHQVEDRAAIPKSPVKFDRYVEQAVFQYHPVRQTLASAPAIDSTARCEVVYPYGRSFVRTLSPQWRAVVAALARAAPDYRKAIVPHVVEFKDYNGALLIEFYDGDQNLVHVHKEVSIWMLTGVDHDNWWNEYAPGMDGMKHHDLDQHYDPRKQLNILCAGRQPDDAMCGYLCDVLQQRMIGSKNSAVFVGAGILGGASWIDRGFIKHNNYDLGIFENFSKGTNYPWGEVVQRIALTAAKSGTRVTVETPPGAQITESKQYTSLSKGEAWRHVVLDGCTHGQRFMTTNHQGQSCVKYCNKEGDGRLVSMPAKGPKKKLDGVVVEFLLGKEANVEGSDRHVRVMLDGPPKSVAQEEELVKKVNKLRGYKLRTPVLFTVSLRRSGGGSDPKGGTDAQGDRHGQ